VLGYTGGFLLTFAFLFLSYGLFSTMATLWYTYLMLIPLIVDGTGQFFMRWESNNTVRFTTGYIAGMALSYFYYSIYAELYFGAESAMLPSLFSLLPIILMPLFILLYERPPKKYAKKIWMVSDFAMLASLLSMY